MGGGWPQAARRAIRYGDAWMPIAGRDGDIAQRVPEFRKLAEEAGRNPAELGITIFGAGPQPEELQKSRDAGVERVIFFLPPDDRDAILPRLDRLAQSMSAVG